MQKENYAHNMRPVLQTTTRNIASKRALICTRVKAGMTNAEIAKDVGVNIGMVRAYKSRFCSQPCNDVVLGKYAVEAMNESYEKGMSIEELSEEYNIPERMVLVLLANPHFQYEQSAVEEELQNQQALEEISNPVWQPQGI